jgi:hypothetical protein
LSRRWNAQPSYGLARAIMNDAMVKKIAAVKVIVTRGSHVCA